MTRHNDFGDFSQNSQFFEKSIFRKIRTEIVAKIVQIAEIASLVGVKSSLPLQFPAIFRKIRKFCKTR